MSGQARHAGGSTAYLHRGLLARQVEGVLLGPRLLVVLLRHGSGLRSGARARVGPGCCRGLLVRCVVCHMVPQVGDAWRSSTSGRCAASRIAQARRVGRGRQGAVANWWQHEWKGRCGVGVSPGEGGRMVAWHVSSQARIYRFSIPHMAHLIGYESKRWLNGDSRLGAPLRRREDCRYRLRSGVAEMEGLRLLPFYT